MRNLLETNLLKRRSESIFSRINYFYTDGFLYIPYHKKIIVRYRLENNIVNMINILYRQNKSLLKP